MNTKTPPTTKFEAVMIDIETLGTKTGSIIYQLAAVEFCPDTFQRGSSIEMNICPIDSAKFGLTEDDDTIAWHKEKGHELPRIAGRHKGTLPLGEAIHKLTTFLTETINPKQFWCRGTDFDFPMIKAAIEAFNKVRATSYSVPWKYYQCHDLRTVWNIAFPYDRPSGADHTALADCHAQIDQLNEANNRIIDLCVEGLSDRQLIDIARKRGGEALYGKSFSSMSPKYIFRDETHLFPGMTPITMPARNFGKTAFAKAAMAAAKEQGTSKTEWQEAINNLSQKPANKLAPKAPDFEDLYLAANTDAERIILMRTAKRHYINKLDLPKALECAKKEKDLTDKAEIENLRQFTADPIAEPFKNSEGIVARAIHNDGTVTEIGGHPSIIKHHDHDEPHLTKFIAKLLENSKPHKVTAQA